MVEELISPEEDTDPVVDLGALEFIHAGDKAVWRVAVP